MCEGKYTKPYPYIVLHYMHSSVKRCTDKALMLVSYDLCVLINQTVLRSFTSTVYPLSNYQLLTHHSVSVIFLCGP